MRLDDVYLDLISGSPLHHLILSCASVFLIPFSPLTHVQPQFFGQKKDRGCP